MGQHFDYERASFTWLFLYTLIHILEAILAVRDGH